jgi:tRNA threonylcarbamoyladenosine biosynthesis protein TsaE
MKQIYNINNIKQLSFSLKISDIVFLNWDLWAWKTTISKHILNNILSVKENITSPTYTYYNKYEWILDWKVIDIYHFDLYRLNNYDEFFAIWAEDILDNNNWIILVEWPDIIKEYYQSNLTINLFKLENENERRIEIIKK